MKSSVNDLLSLFVKLSQMEDTERVIAAFVSTINSFHSDFSITFCQEADGTKIDSFMPIKTDQSSFGFFRINGDAAQISPQFPALLKDAVQLLASILQKIDEEKLTKKRTKQVRTDKIKYNQLIQLTREGIWVIDGEAKTTFVNPSMAEMLGYKQEEMIGKRLFDFTDDEHAAILREKLERRKKEIKGRHDFEFQKKDGSKLLVTLDYAPILDEKGNYQGAIASVIDITERKNIENSLWLSEIRFRLFFENQANYCYMVSPDGKILDVNQTACRRLGYRKEELVGKPILSIYTPKSKQKARELFEIWRKTGVLKDEELQIQTKSGEKRSVILNVNSVTDANNKIIHSISVQQDITEQTQIHRNLLKLTVLADTLTDFPPDQDIYDFLGENVHDLIQSGIVVINLFDSESVALRVHGIFGLSPSLRKKTEQIFGKKLSDFNFSDFSPKVLDGFRTGKLVTLKCGMYDALMKQIPEEVCKKAEEVCQITGAHVVGIRKKDVIYGNVTIFSFANSLLLNDIIETFVNQVANTISRIESEKELRISRQRLALALESAGIGLWDQDFVTGKVFRSKEWAEMLGYSLKEIESRIEPWYNLIHPDDLKEVEKITELHESGKIPHIKIEHRMRAKDGEWRWIQNWGRIVERDKKGRPLRAVGTHIDITERKLIELELLQSKTRLETIFENAPVGIWFMNADNSGFRANKKFYEITGEKPSGQPDKYPTGKVHPEDYDEILKIFYQSIEGKATFHRQFRLLRPDGEVRHVLGQILPQRTPEGETLGFIATITDITEQLQAQVALQEREATLSSIFRSAPIGIGLVSDRVFLQVNDHFCEMVGYARDELIGQNARMIYPSQEEFERAGKEKYEQIQQSGKGTIETQFRTKQGKILDVLISSSAIDLSDLEKGVTFTVMDITESKRAERELRQSEQHYRSLVETIPDIVLIFDKNFRIQFASPSLENQTGYSISDIEKHDRGLEFVYSDDAPIIIEKMKNFVKSPLDISLPIEFRIKDKRGKIHWYSSVVARTEFYGELAFLLIARDISVNKEIEMKLRESERQFATFMDELPAGVFIKDKNSVILYVNKYMTDVFDARHWLGKDCYKLFPKPVSNKMRADDLKTLAQGLLQTIETLPDKEGTPRIFETRKFVIQRETEEPLIGGVSMDITDRVQSEEALIASERKYRALFSSLNEGVALHEIIYDKSGKAVDYRILDVNPAFEKLIGIPRDQANGELASKLYQMEPPPFLAVYARVSETRKPLIFENFFETMRKHFIVAVFSPQKGQFATAFLDITEAKEAEKALRENEERFRLIVQNIPVMVDAFDEKEKIVFWNKECEHVTGFSAKEIVGNPNALNLLYPDKKYLHSLLKEWKERRNQFSGWEMTLTTKSGEERVISWHNISAEVPIPGWTSWSIGIDITEQKHAEAQVKKYTENLEKMVAERTRELEEKTNKLEESQKALTYLLEDVNESRNQFENLNVRLQEANQDLESFAYSVSHDLRAPLRHIDGFSRMLLEQFKDNLEQPAQHYLENISDAAQQMAQLIESLLQFSRMGRVSMNLKKVAMNAVINNVLDNLKFVTEQRKIKWQIDPLPEPECDEMLIRQVWVNLISNALKFTRRRRIAKIEISCQEEADQFVFSIRDNGVGFNMKFADKLFGVFQRLHSKKDFEGIGIGLANVKRIVQRHGGKIWAQAKVNKGATFYFTLPKTGKGSSE
ncbi:MAG: PAS domain S-box protein [Calditrichaeota bacterium]|nr:PAS domain S-box protein [Calditrichota bacterium]